MGIFDLFSKRQKQLRGEVPDVFTYDTIPRPLKVQIIHIWTDTLGHEKECSDQYGGPGRTYKLIVDTLCREYGLFELPTSQKGFGRHNYSIELGAYLLEEKEIEKVLDVVELSFRFIDGPTRRYEYLRKQDAALVADLAIDELNSRFREHGVGFQFIEGKIIRVDSQLLHAEVMKPALALLNVSAFAGAQAEFLRAHEHYRHGSSKEALMESLKALESVMKVICEKRKWSHQPNATSKQLLDVLFQNGLIPKFWDQHFAALRSSLESGVPTARNRLGGHGQGATITVVPTYLVGYVLHITASAIVFIVEAERAIP